MRRTKIVCTIGPATNSSEKLRALIRAGMNVARLNFSHGTHDQHAETFRRIRALSDDCGRDIAVLQDLPGPKLRIGEMAAPVELEPGQSFTFTAETVLGDCNRVTLPHPELLPQASKGASIFVDDANLEFRVVSADEYEIRTKSVTGGELSSRKGVVIPGARPAGPGVTSQDIEDLRFGLELGVDWVASSFVCQASDVEPLRQVMQETAKYARLMAKIERPEALKNIDAIIAAYDGIMVARGDLGIELPIHEVPVVQKQIIRKCNLAGKPVITATQMLDSMIRNPRPTRAEVTDVANAIFDGTDATMLSGETAVGKYPVQAVEMMSRVAVRTEKALNYRRILRERVAMKAHTITDAIGQAAAEIAEDLEVSVIITCTATGTTTRLLSKYRPRAHIVAAASRPETVRQLGLSWGVAPVAVPEAEDTDDMIDIAVRRARECGYVKEGETVVVIAGVPVGVPGNTSLVRVLQV